MDAVKNKKRLVYAEDVKALAIKLRRTVRIDKFTGLWPCLLLTDINEVPTADAVEVVHGRWIQHSNSVFNCSVCDIVTVRSIPVKGINESQLWNYCPNCGAKMDGGVEP